MDEHRPPEPELPEPEPFAAHFARGQALAQVTCARLCLSDLAADVLSAFLPLELDPEVAAQTRADDPHNRPGVLSWADLIVPDDEATISALEEAVSALVDWGLLQLVGLAPGDPPVSGPAAMRLTHAGRVGLGLAPARRADVADCAPCGWTVLHGASREALAGAAWEALGLDGRGQAALPLPLSGRGGDPIDHVCAQIATRLLCQGYAIVDGFPLVDETPNARVAAPVIEQLLARTAWACGPRLLLLPEPAVARLAAWSCGGALRWIEPQVDGRRQGLVLDARMSALLQAHGGGADLAGVPDSELAVPRRVQTAWEDMLLADGVALEFQQALMHARFRLAMGGVGRVSPGYRLLLSGLPGTGKSMAAEALATTLDRSLIKLDLSAVLSKWLGETEKLLAQVFDVAESAGAVLVLDEAESLLRQREGGAQGNHALGTGVAYLLTRLERYSGVLVATTNRTRDLDEAFFRRFDDFIILPIPDEPTRARLWRRHLQLADAAPTQLDLSLLAQRFPISGGLIRGAALRARSWSEGMSAPLSTPHVLAALGRELEKSDRASHEVFVEPYVAEVRVLMRGATRAEAATR